MPSKAYHRFLQRLIAYEADLELTDVLIRNFVQIQSDDRTVCQIMGGNADFHTRLQACPNTDQARKILGSHLKTSIYTSFIKELYEDFSEFIATSLSRAALAGVDPARFAGEVKLDIHAREILQAGSWEAVIRLISDKIFRALENERNTRVLINKMSARVGLQLDETMLGAAMPYLDARHILVHRDGRPDAFYIQAYPNIARVKGAIVMNHEFVGRARDSVKALAEHIDARMIGTNLVRQQDMAGQR